MKWQLIFLPILFILIDATVINRNLARNLDIPTDTPSCSTNASTAYLDVILIIDTSVNMGTSNLKKIGTMMPLILSKFTIGQQSDISQGYRNTRVSVVTFDNQAVIAANYTDINSASDLSMILNGLTISNSQEANLYDGVMKADFLQTGCVDFNCTIESEYVRPTAMMIFAADANENSLANLSALITQLDFIDAGATITVNFNTANQALTNLLQNITNIGYLNISMYNFISSSNSLTRDLEWAMLQANCYCGDIDGISTIYYDQNNGRYSRYAECMSLNEWEGVYPNDTIDMCNPLVEGLRSPVKVIPGFVLSNQREIFVQNVWIGPWSPVYPFYFGLHKNNQSQWVFYNYDGSEFSVSSYTNWSPGYPNGTNACAILDSNDGKSLVWKNYDCNTKATQLDMVLCQGKSCDASSLGCCEACLENPNFLKKTKKIRSKSHHIKRMKMINGKHFV